jgi:hypothetical protein
MSVNVGASPSREEGSIAGLSWVRSDCSLSTCCACVEAVLYRLACCCPVLDGDDGILSNKVISTLSGGDVVWSSSVRGDGSSSPFSTGVNRAVCGVAV